MAKKSPGVDITPRPRILRVLGEIPFQTWQCFAELIDNSLDAFMRMERTGNANGVKSIIIRWSNDGVAQKDRVVEVIDTAEGMDLQDMSNMARAGYSGNNPVDNLGLFGMGFNIATARLGEKTQVVSAKIRDREWTGIEIDFAELIKGGEFFAPVVKIPKRDKNEHGTRVIVSKIKPGIYRELLNNEIKIRRRLEAVYSSILSGSDIEFVVQAKRLSPHPYCIWSAERYVMRNGRKIPAVIKFDIDLGKELFDAERNAYVPEEAFGENEKRPRSIIERPKRLTGWVGIQRFSDPNDFGIDFVRNGRKILVADKSLFYFENPDTGTPILEYPVELASTWGGRIIGEIKADFLLPTYQKNDFDRNDKSWRQVVEALRGSGPVLPKLRKIMGYSDDNESPLGLLINAYRRQDPGTKNLSAEQKTARQFADKFYKNDQEYLSDDRWWEAAQEADRGPANIDDVDAGSSPSDDASRYLVSPESSPTATQSAEEPVMNETSDLADLLRRSKKIEHLSRQYTYSRANPFTVAVRELTGGEILIDGKRAPAYFAVDGIRCDFFYDPRHFVFLQYQILPETLLSIYLAERFKSRDMLKDLNLTFSDILRLNYLDLRIDKTTLQEKADSIFDAVREKMKIVLEPMEAEAISYIKESTGETEETMQQLFSNGELMQKFQDGSRGSIEALSFVPIKTLIRLIDRFPGEVLDGNVFSIKYQDIALEDERATERLRTEAKDRLISFLKDAAWISSVTMTQAPTQKEELIRCSHSIKFLEAQLCQ